MYSTIGKTVLKYDVKEDLKHDKVLKRIRKDTTRDIGELLFDSNTWND